MGRIQLRGYSGNLGEANKKRIEYEMQSLKITTDFVNRIIRMNDGLRDRFHLAYKDMLEIKALVDAQIREGMIRGITGYAIFPEFFFGYNREDGIPSADAEALMWLSDETQHMFPSIKLTENDSELSEEYDFLLSESKLSYNIEDLKLPGLENHYIYMFMHHIFQDAGTYCIADIQYLEPEDLRWQITVQYEKL